jgi:hypothetical protein
MRGESAHILLIADTYLFPKALLNAGLVLRR